VEQPTKIKGVGAYQLDKSFKLERGAYVIPLHKGTTWAELRGKQ
jgi:hypothetical protein